MTPGAAKTSIEGESDTNLVTMIGWSSEDSETGRLALEILHSRHSQFLTATAIGCGIEKKGVDPESAVARTFQKVWQHATSFDSARQYPNTRPDRAVRLW